MLERIGWELLVVPLPGYTIHLDLHLTMVDVDRALVDVPGLPFEFLEELGRRGIETIHPDPGEAWALNALCLRPGRVLMAEGSPRTAERLARAGVEVVTVPYDEIHKQRRRRALLHHGAGARARRRVIDAAAVVARLRELDARSGGRRVAWTEPVARRARAPQRLARRARAGRGRIARRGREPVGRLAGESATRP